MISRRCTYNVGNSWFSKGRGNENTFGGNFGSLKKEMIYRWYFLPEKKSKIWLLAKGVCLKGFLRRFLNFFNFVLSFFINQGTLI